MFVESEEEKQYLEAQLTDARREATLPGDSTKELGDRIALLASAEEGSDLAINGPGGKWTRRASKPCSTKKLSSDISLRNKAEQAQQQRKIS